MVVPVVEVPEKEEEPKKHTHRVEVVPIVLEPHPDPETTMLSLARVYDFTVVVRTQDWEGVPFGAYIQPDSVVPDTPEFEFLGKNKRITVRRFRGVYSQGLLMPAPEGSKVGDDVSDLMGITRYEPRENVTMYGHSVRGPEGVFPKYDVENWAKFNVLFDDGEEVIVTEKIHGANARFKMTPEDEMFCGSRTQWKKEHKDDLWWKCLDKNPWIRAFCEKNRTYTLYGEVFGNVQNLKYGAEQNDVFFRAFDVWDNANNRFLTWPELGELQVPGEHSYLTVSPYWVPTLYVGPYDKEKIRELADGNTLIPGAEHIREGIVVHPRRERYEDFLGDRLKLKLVSNKYYESDAKKRSNDPMNVKHSYQKRRKKEKNENASTE